MDKWREKILRRMTIYYNNEEKAIDWYNRPNENLAYYRKDRPTPKEMIEDNRGKELWKWIKIAIE